MGHFIGRRRRSRQRGGVDGGRDGSRTWDNLIRKRLVIVGDGEVGKTSLLMVFSRDVFPVEHIPTIFEITVSTIVTQMGDTVELILYDTAGQEDYDRLRQLSYPTADVILISFSVDNPDSFHAVTTKWHPEVAHFCPNVPVILVGSKSDLRGDKSVIKSLSARGLSPVTQSQGCALANKLKAFAYLECSAKTTYGVRDVFETAARASVLRRSRAGSHSTKCVIL